MADLIAIYEKEICHKVEVGTIAFDTVRNNVCIVRQMHKNWPGYTHVNYYPGIWADYELTPIRNLLRYDIDYWRQKLNIECPCDPVCDFCIDLTEDYNGEGLRVSGWCKTHGYDMDLSDSCPAFKCKNCGKTY